MEIGRQTHGWKKHWSMTCVWADLKPKTVPDGLQKPSLHVRGVTNLEVFCEPEQGVRSFPIEITGGSDVPRSWTDRRDRRDEIGISSRRGRLSLWNAWPETAKLHTQTKTLQWVAPSCLGWILILRCWCWHDNLLQIQAFFRNPLVTSWVMA